MSILDLLVIFASGIATGVIGAMLGVGGGVFIIPILVIALGIPVRTAIAASIIAVIATSSAAAGIYLGSRLSNIRLGMTLETATTIGGLGGGIIAVSLSQGLLQWLFAGILMLTAAAIWRRAQQRAAVPEAPDEGSLGSHYYDPALQRTVRYRPVRLPVGWGVSLLAGVASGLFGIGGGVIKVPAMVLGMRVPTKAAMATSDFMIGVTAVASAFVYYAHGDLDILIAAPAAMGTFLGSLLGASWAPRVRSRVLSRIFAGLLLVLAVQMGLRALGFF